MKDVFEAAGIEVTKENKKALDQAVHRFVDVEYKSCSPTWKAFKEKVRDDAKARKRLISELKKAAKQA